jgi:hypothetical protein
MRYCPLSQVFLIWIHSELAYMENGVCQLHESAGSIYLNINLPQSQYNIFLLYLLCERSFWKTQIDPWKVPEICNVMQSQTQPAFTDCLRGNLQRCKMAGTTDVWWVNTCPLQICFWVTIKMVNHLWSPCQLNENSGCQDTRELGVECISEAAFISLFSTLFVILVTPSLFYSNNHDHSSQLPKQKLWLSVKWQAVMWKQKKIQTDWSVRK